VNVASLKSVEVIIAAVNLVVGQQSLSGNNSSSISEINSIITVVAHVVERVGAKEAIIVGGVVETEEVATAVNVVIVATY